MSNKDRFLSMVEPKSEAAFPAEEYQQRLERIRASMADQGLDVLFLSAPESICYVSGYAADWYRSQSSSDWKPASGIAISTESEHYIHFDESDEQLLMKILTFSRDVVIHQHSDPPMKDVIVAELERRGWLKGTVGLEMWSYRPNRGYSEMFQAALEEKGCRVIDATKLVRRLRNIKSERELECVRTAQRMADLGMTAARAALQPGVTELDVYAEIVHAMAKAGSENPAITVGAGEGSAAVHALPSRRKIRPGDLVNIDICGVNNRYHATLARTFSIGRPSAAVQAYAGKVIGAVELVAEAIRPNLPIADLLAPLEEYCRRVGIWEDQWWIGGYELGIAFPPDTVGEFYFDIDDDPGDAVFSPGIVSTFESNFYLPEDAGLLMQISTMAVTGKEASFLYEMPPGIHVV
jgi:Xaa-Pro aminopeptidase